MSTKIKPMTENEIRHTISDIINKLNEYLKDEIMLKILNNIQVLTAELNIESDDPAFDPDSYICSGFVPCDVIKNPNDNNTFVCRHYNSILISPDSIFKNTKILYDTLCVNNKDLFWILQLEDLEEVFIHELRHVYQYETLILSSNEVYSETNEEGIIVYYVNDAAYVAMEINALNYTQKLGELDISIIDDKELKKLLVSISYDSSLVVYAKTGDEEREIMSRMSNNITKLRKYVGGGETEKMDVIIYTDGSAKGNPGPGGYGTIIVYKDSKGNVHEREFSNGYKRTTNNRMELMAAIVGLEALTRQCNVTLYSDSQYLVKAFNEHWIDGWIKKGWTRGDNEPVKNVDLWKRLLNVVQKHNVTFRWVKGHADNPMNNRCDKLATSAAANPTLIDIEIA